MDSFRMDLDPILCTHYTIVRFRKIPKKHHLRGAILKYALLIILQTDQSLCEKSNPVFVPCDHIFT